MLYERYAPVMKGICLRYAGDPETVKDIVQEGFIKLFSQIKQYSGTGSFEGWMKRIFINTAISHIRKHQKSQQYLKIEEIDDMALTETSSLEFDGKTEFSNDSKSNQNNFEIVSSADFSETELLDVLKRIPEKYRIVFNLYCIEDIKHDEIAEMLNIDLTTSRTRLLRARQFVQKELYHMSMVRLSL